MSGGGAEREGDTESEAGSRLWTVNAAPDVGLEPMNCEIMTWDEVGHLSDWATQAPQKCGTLDVGIVNSSPIPGVEIT